MTEIENRIKALKGKRAELKRKITNLNSFLGKQKENPDIANIEVRYETLKTAFNAFEDGHQDHLELDPTSGHSDEYEIVCDSYFEIAASVKKILNPVDSASTAGSLTGAAPPASAAPSTRRMVRLPEISIPTFSGKQVEWLTWKDKFEALIHDQSDLTLAAKMTYLEGALTGEAADKIAILTMRGTDYNEAWENLKECYDNKRLIISIHLDSLLNLPLVDKAKLSEGLTKLADHARLHMKALTKYGINVIPETVVKIIESKLPQFLQNKWDETVDNTEFPKLDDLITFLRRWAARPSVKPSTSKPTS